MHYEPSKAETETGQAAPLLVVLPTAPCSACERTRSIVGRLLPVCRGPALPARTLQTKRMARPSSGTGVNRPSRVETETMSDADRMNHYHRLAARMGLAPAAVTVLRPVLLRNTDREAMRLLRKLAGREA